MESRLLLVTVRVGGEYDGGFLDLLDDEQSRILGFAAAVPQTFHDCHAKEALYDHVFRWGAERGYETYDFGNSRADFENGVYRHKEGFGGRVVPTFVWERPDSVLWRLARYGRRKYLSYHR